MFNNVVVGVDGRPNARDAIALASRLADPQGRVTLVHVHGGALHPLHALVPQQLEQERKASRTMLEHEREDSGVNAELLSVYALSPGRGLHQQAEDLDADLLVVGSSARGAIGRVAMGDDTRSSLNGAPCAVAVAPRGYARYPAPIAKVGVGYDGSPEAIAALALAKEVARPTRASVHALEVVSLPSYTYSGLIPPELGESIDAMLAQADERLSKLEAVEARAVYGLPGEELAQFGDQVDLLVVGSRSYGPLRRLVLGSTSEYLQRHARCALLVLPRTAVRAGDEADGADARERAGAG